MTKTIKLSLAAVMAAGIATSASAQDLSKAIEGVDVSGYVDYRLENKNIKTDGVQTANKSFNINEYSVNATLTSKVNDIVKATVSVGFDEAQTENSNSAAYPVGENQDADPKLTVNAANFTFGLGATTVIAGKQAIPSPFVDQTDTAKGGTGIVALHTVNDSLTVAAAHFMNNNIASDSYGKGGVYNLGVNATDTKTSEFLAIAKIAMVDAEAHYNTTTLGTLYGGTDAKHTFLKLGSDVSGVKVGFKYATGTTKSANGTTWADASVMALTAGTKVGAVSLDAAYFSADKEKGTNTAQSDVALDGDSDAQAHVKVWSLSTAAIANKGNGFALTAGMPVVDKVDVKLTYAAATDDATTTKGKIDHDETLVQATYKMSKNFTLHARYSMMNSKTAALGATAASKTDTDYSRVEVKYTF